MRLQKNLVNEQSESSGKRAQVVGQNTEFRAQIRSTCHLVHSNGSSSFESRAAQIASSGIRTPTLLRGAQLTAELPPNVVHCFGISLLAVRINVYCTQHVTAKCRRQLEYNNTQPTLNLKRARIKIMPLKPTSQFIKFMNTGRMFAISKH
jgi:hypothetical protein